MTEGVQLGEARSAMGVLGMWTGAQHDRMDPIGACFIISLPVDDVLDPATVTGPFWMWKVG